MVESLISNRFRLVHSAWEIVCPIFSKSTVYIILKNDLKNIKSVRGPEAYKKKIL